jgi:hypothetical protein
LFWAIQSITSIGWVTLKLRFKMLPVFSFTIAFLFVSRYGNIAPVTSAEVRQWWHYDYLRKQWFCDLD